MATYRSVWGVIVGFALSATFCTAEDWTTTNGNTYRDIKVLKVEDDSVTILDEDGGARVPLLNLPPALQKRFHYDPVKAKVAANKRAVELRAEEAAIAEERTQEAAQAHDEVVHVLNRITFGPRPGDVEMVEKMGLHSFIEQQLHPETIDDSAVEQEVAKFELLQMTPGELAETFVDDHHKKHKRELPAGTKISATSDAQKQGGPQPQFQASNSTSSRKLPKDTEWHREAAVGQLEQAKLVRAIDSKRQLQEVLVDFWSNHFNIDVKKKDCTVTKIVDDRDVIRPHIWGTFRDLLEASAKSPAMLFYLDNASNIASRTDSQVPPHRLPSSLTLATGAQPPRPKKKSGMNENYAREIMELHTLGVDGGYTQQDVQEVARCFTGWSVDRKTHVFVFRADQHDNGTKVVLGHSIPAGGGIKDGETVLDILCAHPACAHHISLELCQRFVADNPPTVLVDRIADLFLQTGGDLRSVTEAILTSPEFLSRSDYGNKIKSPFEFTVSAIRASGSTLLAQPAPPFDKHFFAEEGKAVLSRHPSVTHKGKLLQQSLDVQLYEMGEPLFACTPPTGYKEISSTWVSPGALIERLNFALDLTQEELSDVRFDPKTILNGTDLDQPETVLNQCIATLLQNNISSSTRKVLEEAALPVAGKGRRVDPTKLVALIIGSPEFQRK